MKNLKLLLSFSMAVVGIYCAASADTGIQSGHWAWVDASSPGPRAPLATRRRIWVSDSQGQSSPCTCKMDAHKGVASKLDPDVQGPAS